MFFNSLKILLTVVILTMTLQIRGQGNLPSVCLGTVGKYWVKGLNGYSDFEWKIIDNKGNILNTSYYNIIGRGDTIEINWSNDLQGGIYTFNVIQHSDFGCTSDLYEQNIIVNSQEINIPFNNVPNSVSICIGDIAEINPGNFINYLWQDNSTNSVYYTSEEGTYKVRLVDINNNCSYNDIDVITNPLPYIWLGNDTIIFQNDILKLDAYNSNIFTYEWSTGDVTPFINVSGEYGDKTVWVKVNDYNGCKNSDTINIKVIDYYDMFKIPSVFTANNDGINDRWILPLSDDGKDLSNYFDNIIVNVYNRWGKLVWNKKGKYIEWDGKDLNNKELPMDSYHYIIELYVKNNKYINKGSITIIR